MAPARDRLVEDVQRGYATLVRRARLSVVQRRVAGDAGVDIDRGAYVVLARLVEWGPIRLSHLAEQLMVDLSTASRHMSRLEEAGHVERSPDPDDRRASVITVTTSGRAIVEQMTAAWWRALDEVLADWDEDELAQLASMLDRFATDFLRLTE